MTIRNDIIVSGVCNFRITKESEQPVMSKSYTVAVAGATGAVGVEMIKTLEKRNFPVKNLSVFGSCTNLNPPISSL